MALVLSAQHLNYIGPTYRVYYGSYFSPLLHDNAQVVIRLLGYRAVCLRAHRVTLSCWVRMSELEDDPVFWRLGDLLNKQKMFLFNYSHTLGSDFHYETYVGISPYRTLAVLWIALYGSYVMCDLIVWENTNVVLFRAIWEKQHMSNE